jgi:hypothetical protein
VELWNSNSSSSSPLSPHDFCSPNLHRLLDFVGRGSTLGEPMHLMELVMSMPLFLWRWFLRRRRRRGNMRQDLLRSSSSAIVRLRSCRRSPSSASEKDGEQPGARHRGEHRPPPTLSPQASDLQDDLAAKPSRWALRPPRCNKGRAPRRLFSKVNSSGVHSASSDGPFCPPPTAPSIPHPSSLRWPPVTDPPTHLATSG